MGWDAMALGVTQYPLLLLLYKQKPHSSPSPRFLAQIQLTLSLKHFLVASAKTPLKQINKPIHLGPQCHFIHFVESCFEAYLLKLFIHLLYLQQQPDARLLLQINLLTLRSSYLSIYHGEMKANGKENYRTASLR